MKLQVFLCVLPGGSSNQTESSLEAQPEVVSTTTQPLHGIYGMSWNLWITCLVNLGDVSFSIFSFPHFHQTLEFRDVLRCFKMFQRFLDFEILGLWPILTTFFLSAVGWDCCFFFYLLSFTFYSKLLVLILDKNHHGQRLCQNVHPNEYATATRKKSEKTTHLHWGEIYSIERLPHPSKLNHFETTASATL